jgi:hypothetical protein
MTFLLGRNPEWNPQRNEVRMDVVARKEGLIQLLPLYCHGCYGQLHTFDDRTCHRRGSSGQILIPAPEAAGRTITLEPYDLDDLEGDLMEVGFSPAAATAIATSIPA